MRRRVISFLLSAVILFGLFGMVAPAVQAAGMKASDACVDMIKEMEGFSKYPYEDNGQYSVGYGTACPDDKLEQYMNNGIPESEAEELLRDYISSFESSLNSFVSKNSLSLSQNQFDALLSFTYNIGSGWMNSESTFRTAVLSGATGNDFIFAIARWCTASGKVLETLIQRRLIEANMYLNGVYQNSVPSNYKYVIFNDNLDGAENDVRVQGFDTNTPDNIRSTPTAEGYTFLGWYTAASGGTKVTVLDADVTVKTLYAHWAEGSGSGAEPETPIAKGVVTAEKLNVRSGPGTGNDVVGYLYEGDTVEIYETTKVDGVTWGRTAKGWISLEYVQLDAQPEEPEKETVIARGVVTADRLNVRSGAGTSNDLIDYYYEGDVVEIYETTKVGDVTWGRTAKGWISLDYVRLDEAEEPEEPEKDTVIARGVVTADRLNVRSGAGTSNDLIDYYYEGDVVEIYETTKVGDVTWGRTAKGWVSLEYVSMNVEAPEIKAANVASSGKIKLTWNAVDGARKYKVYRSTSKDSGYKLLKTTESTSHTNGTAETGTTYYYYVMAVFADDSTSEASNIVKRTCDLPRPEVSLSNVASSGKIKIKWDAVEGAVKYEVSRATSKSGEYTLLDTVTGTSVTDSSAVAGKTYYYKVKAIAEKSAANSANSSMKYRTCDLARPEITLTNVADSGKIKIKWDAVKGAKGYEVYRATSKDGTYSLLKTVTGTSLTNTSAKAGSTYYYKVKAIGEKEAANSAFSVAKYRTCDLARPDVTVKLNSSGYPRLTWAAVDGAVEYEVYRSTSKDGTYKLMYTTETTSYTNTSAKADTTYYYKVMAVASKSAADSAYSKVVNITTGAIS